MSDETTVTFLPWASTEAAALRTGSGINRAPLQLPVTLQADTESGTTTHAAAPALEVLGPGDVIGLGAGQVVRTEPTDGAIDVETTVFPSVDFALPSLPWLLSPAAPAGPQLIPWLALVVVADRSEVVVDTVNGRITAPQNELPPAATAGQGWAWAHVQHPVVPSDGAASSAVAAQVSNGSGSLSRLISPRVLLPYTRYHACVVPATDVGQAAALGASPQPTDPVHFGWPEPDESGNVTVPFYYRFSFTTGDAGDFRALAQRLAAGATTESSDPVQLTGPRLLVEWTDSAGGAQTSAGPMPTVIEPIGAAPATGADPGPWLTGEITPVLSPPELTPPVYGAIQAGLAAADLAAVLPHNTGALPQWLVDINTDPRLRVAAGLGTQVVAAEQENLVAAAYQQLGQISEVNSQLERGRLGRAVRDSTLTRHLSGQDPLTTLQLIGPLADRLQVTGSGSADETGTAASLAASADPALGAKASTAYRRISRPRGAVARHTPPPAVPPLPAPLAPSALLAPLASQPGQPNDRILLEFVTPSTRALAAQNHDTLRSLAPPVQFTSAMLGPLISCDPSAVLPGATSIAPNTALILGDDPAVIAAYLIGLNHAVARLLLWRGVATDRRATPFQSFWSDGGADIAPISQWPDQPLATIAGPPHTILAVRADLFQRYPNTAVYAVRAAGTPPSFPAPDPGNPDGPEPAGKPPLFSALLPPDLRLFVFDIDPATMAEPPGWYFVFQEQVSETRFGTGNLETAVGATPASAGSYWTVDDLTPAGTPQPPDASAVAALLRVTPTLVAIAAGRLLPAVMTPGPTS